MNLNILNLAEKLQPQLVKDRRHLHRHPEVSFEETNTMDYICNRLEVMGISYQRGDGKTGIVAQIDSGKPGKCLLIRADIDALPIEETRESEYKSQNPGVMHACGHDGHTAILLNTCSLLSQLKDGWRGIVKFAFQQGEETTGGAEPMMQAGILENPKVDACIALHMDTDLETGTMRVKAGPMYASPDDFAITIHGKGGHGAEPHLAIDPIVIAAQIITEIQTIVSRTVDPFEEAVITIGSVHAGHAPNVIPDNAKLLGTARSFTNEMRTYLSEKIHAVVEHVCAVYGAKYTYEFIKLFPPLQNDEDIAKGVLESGKRCLGEKNCIWGGRPTMAGEDFAYFTQAVPSAIFKLGCRNEKRGIIAPLHNSDFDIDEDSLQYGVAIFTDFALRFLGDWE